MTTTTKFFRTLAASITFAAASIVTPLAAQTGGPGGGPTGDPNHVPGYFFPYGDGCGSSLMGPIQLSLAAPPEIGQDSLFELSNAVPGNPAWLLVGFAPLNVDLTPIGAWGCHLYVNPVLNIAKDVNAVGTAEFELSIPNDTNLISMHIFTQGVAQDLMANPFGLTLTNGIEASIGGTP